MTGYQCRKNILDRRIETNSIKKYIGQDQINPVEIVVTRSMKQEVVN